MKIYTKTGDKGSTSLLGGSRVSKAHMRIAAYGTIDELNSWIGLLRSFDENSNRKEFLVHIQDRLFTIGSTLAAEKNSAEKYNIPKIQAEDIKQLETEIDAMNELLPEMKSFILPGGHQVISYTHISRTVCRRAEREIVALNEHEPTDPIIVQYLNRLSDFLFVMSRKIGLELGIEDTPWVPKRIN